MKRLLIGVVMAVLLSALLAAPVMAAKGGKNSTCITIQDGILTYSPGHYLAGQPLKVGYDIFGYNYQGHMFKGSYANVFLGGYGFPPYKGDDEAYLAENPAAENNWASP